MVVVGDSSGGGWWWGMVVVVVVVVGVLTMVVVVPLPVVGGRNLNLKGFPHWQVVLGSHVTASDLERLGKYSNSLRGM